MTIKVRVEVINEEGLKTAMEREGNLQNELLKQVTIREITRFLEAQFSPFSNLNSCGSDIEDLTIKERLASFLRYDERAPREWFTSSELKRRYEEVYEEEVRLSTISTYLASLHSDGMLERRGSRAKRQYRVVTTESRAASPSAVNVPSV